MKTLSEFMASIPEADLRKMGAEIVEWSDNGMLPKPSLLRALPEVLAVETNIGSVSITDADDIVAHEIVRRFSAAKPEPAPGTVIARNYNRMLADIMWIRCIMDNDAGDLACALFGKDGYEAWVASLEYIEQNVKALPEKEGRNLEIRNIAEKVGALP